MKKNSTTQKKVTRNKVGTTKVPFIVFEGGEGCGKSTIVKRIAEKYGSQVYITREPGGSPLAEEVRKIVLSDSAKNAPAEAFFGLMWGARADHMHTTVRPKLRAGQAVISDRCDGSTFVYQIFGQKSTELSKIFWQVRDVFFRDIIPTHYIYLDVDVTEGLRRRKGDTSGQQNHFDDQKVEYHTRIQKGYRVFKKEINKRKGKRGASKFVTINANQPLEKVVADVFKALESIPYFSNIS